MQRLPFVEADVGALKAPSLPCAARLAVWAALCLAGWTVHGLAAAQRSAEPAQPAAQQIVVTGSTSARRIADAPHAISVVDADALRAAGPMLNLSEALVRVPGLVANNRGNYAQDLQLSSRGFGARAGFGVRGLRLYSDGIPATMPDGQGQVAHFDLAGAERVEVLRGPFSVLYGNSSGGVVAVFSAPVRAPTAEGGLDLGSFGLRQWRFAAASPLGAARPDGTPAWSLRAHAAAMQIDGFRPHSRARRSLAGVQAGWHGDQDRVVLQLGHADQPAQDPLGLSRAQFEADPYQTTPQATRFNTRKTARQTQAGLAWTRRFDAGALRQSQLVVYRGGRSVAQWLAIEPGIQAGARHGGGVIDFDRGYGGIDARLRWGWDGVELVAGAARETQTDQRRGFENFIGTGAAQVLGTTGRLRREERNSAQTQDGYVQAEWTPLPALAFSAGLRAGRVRLQAEDRFLSNGDDSGALVFDYQNPVAGLRWQAAPGLSLHASAGRGFESPTLGELAYRPDGVGGFNAALKPQRSRQFEAGAKWRAGALSLDAAMFRADTSDEIGVATNAGGRSSFQNVGRTRRSGAELALAWQAGAWRAQLAASLLRASYRDPFLACAGLPCASPSLPVAAGNRLAGTQPGSVWAELAWRDARWGEAAVELRQVGRTAVNDSNSAFAPAYGLVALRWTKRFTLDGGWVAESLLRLDNAGGRRHVGSVIVNDANARFFEPGAPRHWLLALRLSTVR